MPDAYTGTAAVSVDQTAYDLSVYHQLRPMLYYDALCDVQSTNQSFNGSAVVFTIYTDMAAATGTLNESTDVSAVALADNQVTLTLAEYGNVILYTKLLRSVSFVPYDPVVANAIAWNAGLSQDTIAKATFQAGTNVRYEGQAVSRATVIPTDTLKADNVRRALADLQGSNVQDFGGKYAAIIHPDVTYDLRRETGSASWRDPHTYSQPAEIWNGELGEFEGFRFINTATAPKFADAGSSTTLTDVYRTLFLGRQAVAKAYSYSDGNGPYPMFVPGPVTDHLRRNVPLGWYWIGAYGVFRQEPLRAFEGASSIGAN